MPKIVLRVILAFCICTGVAGAAAAAELDGIAMPDSETVDGTQLVLNGLGLRTYSFLRIHIYVAGLYLEHRSSDPDAILASPGPKLLHFVFTHDVDAEAARKSWRESLARNCTSPCALTAESIDRFLANVPAVQKGDTTSFIFTSKGLEALKNGHLLGNIADKDFVRVILTTFIGPRPTAPAVKRGLLGGS